MELKNQQLENQTLAQQRMDRDKERTENEAKKRGENQLQ